MKRILCFTFSFLFVFFAFAGCSKKIDTSSSTKAFAELPDKNGSDTKSTANSATVKPTESASDAKNTDSQTNSKNDKVKVTMADGGTFVIELYPQYAPETCANFKSLVESHFYDGLTFHRVVDNFMAQGGSKDGYGFEGSDKTIKGEFAANGFTQNTLKHTRGVVSMARTNDPNSASSQFFICYSERPDLDGSYAAFGKVIEGMEVVDGFCKVERQYNGTDSTPAAPVNPIIIKTMEVI